MPQNQVSKILLRQVIRGGYNNVEIEARDFQDRVFKSDWNPWNDWQVRSKIPTILYEWELNLPLRVDVHPKNPGGDVGLRGSAAAPTQV